MSHKKEKKALKDISLPQSGSLTNAKHHSTPAGMKLVNASAKMLEENVSQVDEMEFSLEDFYKILGFKSSGKQNKLKKTFKELVKSYVSIETDGGRKIHPWFNSLEIVENEAKIKIRYHEALASYLVYIRNNIYAKETVQTIPSFKKQYSMRIYEICHQILSDEENKGEKTLELPELRSLLGINESYYSKYNDLKRKVILGAQKEINEVSNVCFDFEEEKEGKKVVRLKLMVKTQVPDNEVSSDTDAET